MGRDKTVWVLAFTIPVILCGVPAAFATMQSSSYVVHVLSSSSNSTQTSTGVACNSGDYATGGGVEIGQGTTAAAVVAASTPQFFDGTSYHRALSGQPNAWFGGVVTLSGNATTIIAVEVYVVCQTPLTIPGLGAPAFSPLFSAITTAALLCLGVVILRRKRSGASAV